jgi:hypothetical protein
MDGDVGLWRLETRQDVWVLSRACMIGWLQWYYVWEIVSFRVHFGTLVPTFSLFKTAG